MLRRLEYDPHLMCDRDVLLALSETDIHPEPSAAHLLTSTTEVRPISELRLADHLIEAGFSLGSAH